jgi:hypothetical protein
MRMSDLLFDLQARAAWPMRLRQQTRKTPRRPRPVTTFSTSMLSFGLADSLPAIALRDLAAEFDLAARAKWRQPDLSFDNHDIEETESL